MQNPNKVGCQGNVLLNRAMGSTLVLLPPLSFQGEGAPGLENKLEKYKKYGVRSTHGIIYCIYENCSF